MLRSSDGPRTSIRTCVAEREKYIAACPAELAPPTMYTSWLAHEEASVNAAP